MNSNRPEIPCVDLQCTRYIYSINTLDAMSLQVENGAVGHELAKITTMEDDTRSHQ
jgi:hypothetical protein